MKQNEKERKEEKERKNERETETEKERSFRGNWKIPFGFHHLILLCLLLLSDSRVGWSPPG